MKNSTKHIVANLIKRHQILNCIRDNIIATIEILAVTFSFKNKIIVCGNGGSASDSLHIVGEFMKGFLLERKLDTQKQEDIKKLFPKSADYFIENLQQPLSAISLVSESALLTAYANDKSSDLSFAQQVLGYGVPGDVLIAISTSGNSNNVIYAAQIAKVQGMKVISLTGNKGGELKKFSDITICVPSDKTFLIQEYHIAIYHAICAAVENEMFAERC